MIGLWVTALPRPLAEGLMRDEDPTGAQQRFAPAVAEAEAVCVQRGEDNASMADELDHASMNG